MQRLTLAKDSSPLDWRQLTLQFRVFDMDEILTAALLIAAAVFAPRFLGANLPRRDLLVGAMRVLCGFGALIAILATSIVSVPADRAGVVKRLYAASNLPDGHLVAVHGETGYQAQIIPPGTWRISLLFNLLNSIETIPLVVVPNGFYGRIVARDGAALKATTRSWPTPGPRRSSPTFSTPNISSPMAARRACN